MTLFDYIFANDVEIRCNAQSSPTLVAQCEKRMLDLINLNNFKGEVRYNIP